MTLPHTHSALPFPQIALIPRVAELPFFSGSEVAALHKQEFDHYRCAEYFYQAYGVSDMPEACRKHMASIGYYVFEGAKDKGMS